ncbi:carbohydrate kinase [Rheinheimera riviphila]|uniref:Carbohydrate kinase n=1 Tax=Rheinheimera riviphila TaxID=1834037 RepID=A0A437QGQ4_9GAMM|nr:carbohydrate kinase [Rheinheimera riviphila]RVU33584.1 carbohydrate kinase [Rheinheimera riviphila]
MQIPVCCFGEILIDFLQDPQHNEVFRRFAGGAPANVAVAVAKLGGHSKFIGMVGQDMFGEFLTAQLKHYGVDCSAVRQTSLAKTALAFVALDEQGDRSFSFYRPPAADLLYLPEDCPPDLWQQPGILHLCSNSLTENAIAVTSFALVAMAKAHGWLVSVDANLRHNLWSNGSANRELVTQLLQQADLIKLSDDELRYLAAGQDPQLWLAELLLQKRWVIVTAGAAEVRSYSPASNISLPVTPVTVVDTTAAGDSFVGAWLLQLSQLLEGGSSWAQLLGDQGIQQQIVQNAIVAGSLTCQQFGAFSALPTFYQIKAQWAG